MEKKRSRLCAGGVIRFREVSAQKDIISILKISPIWAIFRHVVQQLVANFQRIRRVVVDPRFLLTFLGDPIGVTLGVANHACQNDWLRYRSRNALYFRSGSRYDHDNNVDINHDVDHNHQLAACCSHEFDDHNVDDEQWFHDDEHCFGFFHL